MVAGNCRIIPALKGDAEPHAELKGLIYADFRKSFAEGYKAVLASLEKEADNAISDSWRQLDAIAEEVFDSSGFASLSGDYEYLSYDFLQINGLKDPLQPSENAEIIYDVVHSRLDENVPLGSKWWEEYRNAQERLGGTYHLVITERPVAISDVQHNNNSPRISQFVEPIIPRHPFIVVFADVSGLSTAGEKTRVIIDAKEELKQTGGQIEPLKTV